MKVQWELVDKETGNSVKVGEVFELVRFMERYFTDGDAMEWDEAYILFGDPTAIKNPIGILNASEI